jgi:plasmid stabilization system protein ParE
MATVVTAPEADRQLEAIDDWWRFNRQAAPNLFFEEFRAAVASLKGMPRLGRRIAHPDVAFLRRTLLRATRYQVYYVTDGDMVMILAVWSAARGAGPDLGQVTFHGAVQLDAAADARRSGEFHRPFRAGRRHSVYGTRRPRTTPRRLL